MEGGPSMDGTPWVPIWVNSTEKVAFDFFNFSQGADVCFLRWKKPTYCGFSVLSPASECKALRADLEDCSKTVQEQIHVMRVSPAL